MNNDTLAGKTDQVKGTVKQSIGEAVGNDNLANSGAADQVKGHAKEAWGNVKDAFRSDEGNVDERHAEHTADGEQAAHNVRQSVVNASEKIKDFVSGK